MDPSKSSAAPRGPVPHAAQGEADVGFTVYRGHPYCQNCHVRLRLPRCGSSLKPGLRLLPGVGCHKPITEGTVEAIGRRWHIECFTCSVRRSVPTALVAQSHYLPCILFLCPHRAVSSLSKIRHSFNEATRPIAIPAIASS